MSKIASINLSWDKTGHIQTNFNNLANIDRQAEQELIAFSSPALLIQQLCVQVRLFGLQTVKSVFQAIIGNYTLIPINESLIRAHMIFHRKDDMSRKKSNISAFHVPHPFLGQDHNSSLNAGLVRIVTKFS